MTEIRRYVTATGKDVFGDWLAKLTDARAQAKIVIRIDRVAAGNFSDCKPLREGVWELRIDWGPGYRVLRDGRLAMRAASGWWRQAQAVLGYRACDRLPPRLQKEDKAE